MKKIFLLFFALLLTSRVNSQIFIENFEYPSDTYLPSTGIWGVFQPGTDSIFVPPESLTFPDYAGSGIGYCAALGSDGEDDSASILPVTSGSMYVSFLLKPIAAGSNNEPLIEFKNGSAPRAWLKVYTKSPNGTDLEIGLTFSDEPTVFYSPPNYQIGQTYLIVAKYEFNPGAANDKASLWVFDSLSPPPATEPAPLIGPLGVATRPDADTLRTIVLVQGTINGTSGFSVIDGIYIDQAWNNSVLPVELASFTSHVNKNNVTLNWSTSSENNNSVFEIERSAGENSWIKAGMVSGKGTTVMQTNYSFNDKGLSTGNYNYRLKQIDFNGNFEYYNLNNEVNIGSPSGYALSQNYPNPFNPSTTINFDIPKDGNVSIKLFDISGKEVETIVNEVKTAGYYTINFNASSLPSGIYFYTLNADNYSAVKKMMLVK